MSKNKFTGCNGSMKVRPCPYSTGTLMVVSK
jgi:hypothetical protein